MKKYSKIKLVGGQQVPHSTIRGLKLAILHKKQSAGKYECECPGGNIHIWDIVATTLHTCAGNAPRKKAARIGKGVGRQNYAARFIGIK